MESTLEAPVWCFERKAWPAIHVTGNDRLDFLQRISSQNFKNVQADHAVPGAFLHGNGTVIGMFMAHVQASRVTLYCEPQSQSVIMQHLDRLHFAEQIEFQAERRDWLEVRGRGAAAFIQNKFEDYPDPKAPWPRKVNSPRVLPAENWNGPGFLVDPSENPGPIAKMLSEEEYYLERAFHLFPRDQVDVNESNIVLEAGLVDHVHRNKGCYPGQEVVERIYTYGNVAKKLVLLESHARELEKGSELFSNEKKVGNVTSRHTGPSSSFLYVATVLRHHATVGNIFSLGAGQPPQLKVLKVSRTTEDESLS
ncbi:MAG: hypothetical protein ABL958_03990 [Bdellovibrionia bacterium]